MAGSCLEQVNYSEKYDSGNRLSCLFRAGSCLIQVMLKTGSTVLRSVFIRVQSTGLIPKLFEKYQTMTTTTTTAEKISFQSRFNVDLILICFRFTFDSTSIHCRAKYWSRYILELIPDQFRLLRFEVDSVSKCSIPSRYNSEMIYKWGRVIYDYFDLVWK